MSGSSHDGRGYAKIVASHEELGDAEDYEQDRLGERRICAAVTLATRMEDRVPRVPERLPRSKRFWTQTLAGPREIRQTGGKTCSATQAVFPSVSSTSALVRSVTFGGRGDREPEKLRSNCATELRRHPNRFLLNILTTS